jgi:hypothetical protein
VLAPIEDSELQLLRYLVNGDDRNGREVTG